MDLGKGTGFSDEQSKNRKNNNSNNNTSCYTNKGSAVMVNINKVEPNREQPKKTF